MTGDFRGVPWQMEIVKQQVVRPWHSIGKDREQNMYHEFVTKVARVYLQLCQSSAKHARGEEGRGITLGGCEKT